MITSGDLKFFWIIIIGLAVCGDLRAESSSVIDSYARSTNKTSQQARTDVETLFNVIREELTQGRRVKIPEFGSFEIRDRKESRRRNKRTGKETVVPARKVPSFRAASELKQLMNSPSSHKMVEKSP